MARKKQNEGPFTRVAGRIWWEQAFVSLIEIRSGVSRI
jgi:hypothetical protein